MYLILVWFAVLLLLVTAMIPIPFPVAIVVYVATLLTTFVAFCFKTLTVRDAGTYLSVRYGSIPVFRKRIPYADMTEARRARSKVADGWGIHYAGGRGWTFNLWGFDCVEIRLGQKIIRVGTDDPDRLARFLEERILREK